MIITPKLSYHCNKFSEKVRHMNDTNSKELVLNAAEAKNLHTDIFALLSKIAELTEEKAVQTAPQETNVSGGNF